jgi:hypothetical protein
LDYIENSSKEKYDKQEVKAMPAYKSRHSDPFENNKDSLKENLGNYQKAKPIVTQVMGISLQGKVYIPFKENALQGQTPKTVWEIPFEEMVELPETGKVASLDTSGIINKVEGLENALLAIQRLEEIIFQSAMIFKVARKALIKKGVSINKVVIDFRGQNPLNLKEGVRVYPSYFDGKYIYLSSMEDAEEKVEKFFG